MLDRGKILVVPAFEPGRGGGHLCRCISLVNDLRALDREAFLFIPADADKNNLFQSINFNPEWRVTEIVPPVDFIVLDRFQTPSEEFSRWKKIAPVIGIDEGGPCRDGFDFLIDILVPKKLGAPPANIADPSLLKFPSKLPERKQPDGILRILVTFGQEDSAGLGLKVARTLSEEFNHEPTQTNTNKEDIEAQVRGVCVVSGKRIPLEITLLKGSLAKDKVEDIPNVRVIESIPNLAEHLGEYDLVITHYGITAYEAVYAQTPVLLVSPTAYHQKLAKAAGFCSIKNINHLPRSFTEDTRSYTEEKKKEAKLCETPWLNSLKRYYEELFAKYKLAENASLAALINNFSPQVNSCCPVCGADAPLHSVCRFPHRTYRRCSKCGVIYMDRICPPPVEYEREYFFESYMRQYGKTYLEDFPNIKAAGKCRLKKIRSLLPAAENMSLLDIGCAYGPFLAAAREEGFSPAGIDPSQDAVNYVTQTLNIPAIQGFFPIPHSSLLIPHSFEVVTLMFVIEHFEDCAAALAEIRNILRPGGVLAFSTPSSSGISGRSSIRGFLSASPEDHRTIWSPVMCKKALSLAGFKVKKIVISGHHPERFPLFGKLAKSKKSPLYWILLTISKIFCLGDTFEVYAIKNEELGVRN